MIKCAGVEIIQSSTWNIASNDILNVSEGGFKSQLGLFLTETKLVGCANGALFLNNMKLEYENYPDDLKNGKFNITVSRQIFNVT